MTASTSFRRLAIPAALALSLALSGCGVLGGKHRPTTPTVGNRVPVLSRIESGAKVDPSLIGFDRLQVVFLRNGGHMTLRDGVMNGPNIGLTIEGSVDTDRNTIAMNGTFIPAYTVNNFFSKIPVVGMLLGGGWNEGLFALNYRVSGRANAPQVSVNPLSVAPGFLRKIFGILDNVGDQPQR